MNNSAFYTLNSEFLKSVPKATGVYLFRDQKGKVLYVGKAIDLRSRLASHRDAARSGQPKTRALIDRAASVETIVTATEKEALLLESSLIKKYRPRYNVLLRDDKSYPWLKVTVDETWPRVMVTRNRRKDGARYFGPYSSPSAMHDTLRLVRALFPLRTCKGREVPHRDRPCLNHQLGLCPAPCSGQADRRSYDRAVTEVIMILEGRRRELLAELDERMRRAANEHKYEQAAVFRDLKNSLSKTLEKQVVVSSKGMSRDVFALVRRGVTVAVTVLLVREGLVTGRRNFIIEDPLGDDPEVMAGALAQFYDEDQPVPGEILAGVLPDRSELLEDWLGEKRGGRVKIKVPVRGDLKSLVRMAEENGRQLFVDREKKAASCLALLGAVAKKLHLPGPPERIECLDISNLDGKQAVGSLVAFRDGEKDPPSYRHYRIRGGDTPDDYGMIREVLERRLAPDRERTAPDLFLIDGGKGQLNIAREVLAAAGLTDEVSLASIAKEKEEEGEKVFLPGRKNPLNLKRHDPVLLFLMRVRDEAHRFGITFHRKLRNKATLSTGLLEIPGLGPKRSRQLLKEMGSLKRVKEATLDELAALKGIGPELARTIQEHFHPAEG